MHDKASVIVIPGMLLSLLLLLCHTLAVASFLALDLLDALRIAAIAEVIIM